VVEDCGREKFVFKGFWETDAALIEPTVALADVELGE
tara:strand:+ start:206 stop:316 length:111 start_codon:yes stop_codon:yes gene_type:complete